MRLEAVRFKEEVMLGKHRHHFKVFLDGTEITRFGIENNTELTEKELTKRIEERLEYISANFIPEEELKVGIDVN